MDLELSTPGRAGKTKLYREALRLAWPLIVSTGSFTVMTFVDRLFLAWYSAEAIQAALPAGLLAFTLVCGFMALAAYANTFVAQYFGAGDLRGCSRSTAQGIFLALLSFPVLLALIPVGLWLMRVAGHPAGVLELERPYFITLMLGCVTTPLNAALSSFFTGRGRTGVTMIANLVANGLNIILDYVMIFGHWGCPRMGVVGAAVATNIAGVVGVAILAGLYFGREQNHFFQTRATFRYDHALFWRMVRFGLPSGIHLALDLASFTIFVMLTGRISPVALAASNIALSINILSFMPLIGLGIAASTLVGQYQGRGDADTAARAGWAAFHIGLGYMLLMGSSFILFPTAYFGLFADRGAQTVALADVLPTGRVLLVIMAVWGLADAACLIIGNALKGAGDTRFVMYYSMAVSWFLLVPGELLLVEWLQAGILTAWAWMAFDIILLGTGLIWRFKSGAWRKIDVLGRQPAS